MKSVAVGFVGHRTTHRDELIKAINSMKATTGIEPVPAKTDAQYLAGVDQTKLGSVKGVFQIAADEELGAAQAYNGLIKSFKDPALAAISGFLGTMKLLIMLLFVRRG